MKSELYTDIYQSNSCKDRNGIGNHKTTTGGNTLKFYTSVRLDIRKG
ncbi:DNA recombination/repair protein RecA [Wolbachia endosymbiont of Litomosoides brasiliensis]|nr:DNA recombination/repair protein RecA [Wolbachia endosymbiont of Litomosoides brasiliensis]